VSTERLEFPTTKLDSMYALPFAMITLELASSMCTAPPTESLYEGVAFAIPTRDKVVSDVLVLLNLTVFVVVAPMSVTSCKVALSV